MMHIDEDGKVTLTPRSDRGRADYLEGKLVELIAENERLRAQIDDLKEVREAGLELTRAVDRESQRFNTAADWWLMTQRRRFWDALNRCDNPPDGSEAQSAGGRS